jgi:hypothetical protein
LVIVVVLAVAVASAFPSGRRFLFGGHASGLSVSASSVQTILGTGSVNSCDVGSGSITVTGELEHGAGDAAVIGFVWVKILDSSGNTVGSVGDQYVGPPFTSGILGWTVSVPYSGQPIACNVTTQVALPPGPPLLPK